MTTPMARLVHYFESFTGTVSWADMSSIYDDLFHSDVAVHTAEGVKTCAEWREVVHKLVDGGLTASVQRVEVVGTDTLRYTVKLTYADGKVVEPTSIATFKDGKYWKHATEDKAMYSKIANEQ